MSVKYEEGNALQFSVTLYSSASTHLLIRCPAVNPELNFISFVGKHFLTSFFKDHKTKQKNHAACHVTLKPQRSVNPSDLKMFQLYLQTWYTNTSSQKTSPYQVLHHWLFIYLKTQSGGCINHRMRIFFEQKGKKHFKAAELFKKMLKLCVMNMIVFHYHRHHVFSPPDVKCLVRIGLVL